ncbi:MAG: hypothetical protein IJ660_03215 [Alphaproteobacteria bacterium]|nr:hypothetical protein [Alphaproteobacteria bacterium]
MKHADLLKKELGFQLGLLRLKQRKKLSRVATDLGLKEQVIDQIENGYHHTWKRYYELLKYYHGTIGIMLDK